MTRTTCKRPIERVWRGALLLVLTWAIALGARSVVAQQATPVGEVPPATLCTVETPSYADFASIVATPAAGIATPVLGGDRGTIPNGTPADPVLIDEITDLVREYVACFNSGGPLRAYGLYADAYLRRVFVPSDPLTEERYADLAERVPAADGSEAVAFLSVDGVRAFEDGSAGATVNVRFPGIPVDKHYFFLFTREEDAWQIAEIIGEINFSVP